MSKKPYEKAAEEFGHYAGQSPDDCTSHLSTMAELQVKLAAWQNRNFGPPQRTHLALGVCEEAGELAHSVLKAEQGIRGMDDREAFLAEAGDAIADCAVFLIQLSTLLRLDFETLLEATAGQVMARDWTGDAVPE